MTTKHSVLAALVPLLCGSGAGAGFAASYVPCTVSPPAPDREFRGVWVASVGNIDWPSTNGFSTAQQKAELVSLLDRAVELRLNTIVLQVRPACDALYFSRIEPWSEYLTGTMGKPPEPFYDPLAFALEQAHKRGLELHAWFNPFRARFSGAKSPVAPNHVSRLHPQWVRPYGRFLWLDPGQKEVQNYSLSVVMDVVNRYDIDGVHFDDYFYPYREKDAAGNYLTFPDDSSWRRSGAGGRLSREDWRRENINLFVERVYRSIKAKKPWVKFGISPFGIWRPLYPPSVRGLDAYADLFADSRLWLAKGWVDYFAPQLYWSIDSPGQSFPVLLKWWSEQNVKNRQLLAGLNANKVVSALESRAAADVKGGGDKWKPGEILEQIRCARRQAGASGHIHWSIKSLMNNGVLDSMLAQQVYAEQALPPACPWLGGVPPARPKVLDDAVQPKDRTTIRWAAGDAEKPARWLVQTRLGEKWSSRVLPGNTTALTWNGVAPEVVVVTAVNRYGALGQPAALEKLSRPE